MKRLIDEEITADVARRHLTALVRAVPRFSPTPLRMAHTRERIVAIETRQRTATHVGGVGAGARKSGTAP